VNEHYDTSTRAKAQFSPKSILVLLAISLNVIIYMAIPKTWEEAVTQKEDGSYGLSKIWEKTITRKVEKIKKHRLYMLVAAQNGYFECKQSPVGRFYLKREKFTDTELLARPPLAGAIARPGSLKTASTSRLLWRGIWS
jgi:hypothetical protein